PTGSTSTPPSSPRNSSSAPASRRMPRIPLTPIVSPHLETTLSLRSEKMLNSLCPERDSNSNGTHVPGDFESRDGSIHHNNLAHSHSASVGVRSRPIPS